MSFFGKLIRTAVNVVTLPVAVAKDIITLGNVWSDPPPGRKYPQTFTEQKLEQIKREAEDD